MNMRADTSSLVERLRTVEPEEWPTDTEETCRQAADRLESYALLVERMREALGRVRNGLEARDSSGRVVEPVGNGRLIEIIAEALSGTQGG